MTELQATWLLTICLWIAVPTLLAVMADMATDWTEALLVKIPLLVLIAPMTILFFVAAIVLTASVATGSFPSTETPNFYVDIRNDGLQTVKKLCINTA